MPGVLRLFEPVQFCAVPLSVIGISCSATPSRNSGKARAYGSSAESCSNLGLIGYFKYAGFLVSGMNEMFSAAFVIPHIALPVGISFYTFEQIGYLVETRQSGRAEPLAGALRAVRRLLPHLIAGPIIRPHQLFPQFSAALGRFDWQNLAVGTIFLLFGLFKKTVLADGMATDAAGLRRRGEGRNAAASSMPGSPRWPTPSRSISISPAIPTWRSGSA